MDPQNSGDNMIYAIVRRASMFVDDEYSTHPVSNDRMQVVKDKISVYPIHGDVAQALPDWVEKDALFNLGIQEGWVIEVSEQSAKAAQEREEKKKLAKQTDKQPVGLQQGWGGGGKKS
jgi:hypothetical protein